MSYPAVMVSPGRGNAPGADGPSTVARLEDLAKGALVRGVLSDRATSSGDPRSPPQGSEEGCMSPRRGDGAVGLRQSGGVESDPLSTNSWCPSCR